MAFRIEFKLAMKAQLIINPKAGRRKGTLESIKATLKSPEVELTIHQTRCAGDATVVAKESAQTGDFDVVIAAGGDGTIREVASGLVHSETALGIIPVGTENVLAREMGIPLDPVAACQHLLDSSTRTIDVGRLGEEIFVCFCGVGFDADVAYNLPQKRKTLLGSLAYALTSVERIGGYRKISRSAQITVDDHKMEADFWMLLIGNIRTYGGGLTPAPKAKLDDGLLDVCLFPTTSLVGTAKQMMAASSGHHLELPGVEYFQAKKITIETDPAERVQLDGDATEIQTPVEILVEQAALKVRY